MQRLRHKKVKTAMEIVADAQLAVLRDLISVRQELS